MKMKIILWIIVMIANFSIVFAQTGLFSGSGGASFAKAGIVFVIIIFVIVEVINSFKNFRK